MSKQPSDKSVSVNRRGFFGEILRSAIETVEAVGKTMHEIRKAEEEEPVYEPYEPPDYGDFDMHYGAYGPAWPMRYGPDMPMALKKRIWEEEGKGLCGG